ncbi:MAG: hypothetical protein K0B85_07775 [Coriobacteriia bacterium]|nr:hypothetical protein [Coriobacteriia bacterium]
MARPPYPGKLHYFIGSRTRARVIERLFSGSQPETYLRELGRHTRSGLGALHREVTELKRMGLVSVHARGGARYFVPDTTHPLYEPLRALVEACETQDRSDRTRLRPGLRQGSHRQRGSG